MSVALGSKTSRGGVEDNVQLSEREFDKYRKFIYDAAGIDLGPAKAPLVSSRLAKRLRILKLKNYGEYFRFATEGGNSDERQTLIDLLTTNETYFFREPHHFEYLCTTVLPEFSRLNRGSKLRVWSGASSSGEEAYSIAMTLANERPGEPWEIFGSDISSRVLETARKAHYSMHRTDGIPADFLKRFCLRGTGEYDGTLLIKRELRDKVRFDTVNLNANLPSLGQFHVVFLRNVIIYFDPETKKQIVDRVLSTIVPGGYLFIGHSESLKDLSSNIRLVGPTIYQKAA